MRYLLMIAAVLATLTSCSLQKDDAGEKYLAEDLRVFLDAGNTSDTIEMVDSFGMKDKFVQTRKVKREEDRMDFRVKGDWFYLDMKISIYPSTEGGFVEMTTWSSCTWGRGRCLYRSISWTHTSKKGSKLLASVH